MKLCPYCHREVFVDEWGALYYIEDDESLTYSHAECLEIVEGVAIYSHDDNL